MDPLNLLNDEDKIMYLCENIKYETNQWLALNLNCSVEIIRKYREYYKIHNKHNVDDTEIGNQIW